MVGIITPCFSDQNKSTFERGIMRISANGKRTNDPFLGSLAKKKEGVNYYIKKDPDFKNGTYSVCHQGLRRVIRPGDYLFFRTLWRGRQYLIGYFFIKEKSGSDPKNPVLVADLKKSKLVHFSIPITSKIVKKINPKFSEEKFKTRHPNQVINEFLGRYSTRLSYQATKYLLSLFQN
ncbi:MAG: hypothetical protein AB1333_03390 [Patescibacteria group bacterium]